MRIGIVTTWFERGAAYVSKLYKDLLEEEHEVFIYARGGEEYAIGDPMWDGEYVHWAKKYEMPQHHTYIDKKDFVAWLKENDIETVLFNEQRWWQPIKICKEMNIKTGAYIDYYTDITLDLFGLYDFLICNTKRHYSAMSWHKQSFYVPWGTDVHLFAPPTKEQLEQKKGNDLVYFHSAGMSPFRKGTDFVILAFNKLVEEYSNCKLVIHTQIDLLKFFPDLSDVISKLVDEKKLEVIEKTVSAPGLYYLGDVYVYPSRIEGIGLTIAEAISSGLPTVTVDNGPMNEFISSPSEAASVKKFYCRSDGYYWPLCEVNVDHLKDKMEKFIIQRDQLTLFKDQTREYAIEHLNWENNKKEVQRIFEESKILPYKNQLIQKIDKFDTSIYPMIIKYPRLYSYIHRFFKSLRKRTL